MVVSHRTIESTPSPDRRTRNSAERRERLFRAAMELFARKGFTETTVEDITNAADLGKGTFFNYFPSKEHILLAFAEMQFAKLKAAVDEARTKDEPVSHFFRSLGPRMTQEPMRNPAIIRILLQTFISNTDVREAMTTMQGRVLALHAEMMELGQKRGEIRKDLPPLLLAQAFRQLIFGTLLIWSLDGDASLPSRMENAFEVMWSGLRPRATGSEARLIPSQPDGDLNL
jgi:AcrR family transcriptional regulator